MRLKGFLLENPRTLRDFGFQFSYRPSLRYHALWHLDIYLWRWRFSAYWSKR